MARISIEQIKAYYQRAFTASNATIVLVGDLSHEQARQMAEHIAGTLPTGPALPSIPAPAATEPELYHLEHPGTQTTLLVGLPAPAANHPDRAALTVLNQILGGKGLRTRLMHELRTRRGLTYGAYSRLQLQRSAGIWGMQLGVEHRYRDATLHVVEQLLHDYVEHGPTQQELDDTRRKLLGELLLASASNAGKLAQLQDIAFNQLAPDHQAQFINAIQALSIDQLKVVLKNHLQIDKLVQISVGPLSDQEPLPTHTTD
ncbi:pitrilysin family protein [Pseudomonas aegrilactucae]|uniref:M16 family metallopeptidase n=1 Tax=Pseudomonas aegrilactucae TaxID=2854028 RepID=UPI003134242C